MHRAPVTLVALIAALAAASVAHGAEIPVTTTGDGPIDGVTNDGLCSLREAAVAARNDVAVQGCPAGAGPDTVRLGAGTFAVSQPGGLEDGGFTGDLDVGGPAIRVVGAGAGATVIAVTTVDRAFDVLPQGSLALEDLTVRGGRLPFANDDPGGQGAGVRSQGALSLTRVVMDDNVAAGSQSLGGSGGAIWSGNALYAPALTVVHSTFTGNRAGRGEQGGGDGGSGGAIRIEAGSLSVSGSTFVDNAAGEGSGTSGNTGGRGGDGGAIAVGPGTATVVNSTFASNRGGDGGQGRVGRNPDGGRAGAIWVSGGSALVEYSTFLGNVSGLASLGPNGIAGAIVGGSILADPEFRCGGIVAHLRNVLSSPDASCPAPALVGPVNLGLVAANGGPTATLLPGAGSAAIDALAGAACPATDQRGLPRPALGGCDAGAVEVQAAAGPAPGGPPGPAAARRLTRLRLSPSSFRAAGSGGSIGTAAKSLLARAPIGATVTYRLDGAARVTFTIQKPVAGRRKGKRCVRPPAAPPGARRCTRKQLLKGSFAHQGAAGANSLRFTGRLRRRALAPGAYTLIARLPKPATAAAARTARAFRIVA